VLTLTGSATVAELPGGAALGDLRQRSTNPSTRPRTVSVVANDGTANSNTATRTITVGGDQRRAGGDDDGAALAFTEGNSATVVDAGLTVTDADSPTWRVRRSRSRRTSSPARIVLGFTTQNGITGSFNATTGRPDAVGLGDGRELPGGAALGDLRQREHQPVDATRTVSVVANDGTANSNTATADHHRRRGRTTRRW
jgi:hypothetical protein